MCPEGEELGAIHERHEIYRTSPESPRSQQMCIALVLRAVISTRAGELFFFVIILFSKQPLLCYFPVFLDQFLFLCWGFFVSATMATCNIIDQIVTGAMTRTQH